MKTDLAGITAREMSAYELKKAMEDRTTPSYQRGLESKIEPTVKIEYVDIESIRVSGINPKNRANIERDDDLLDSMRERGFLETHPILLTQDRVVGDGHRRLRCAEILGIKQIPVIITDKTVVDLMGENAGIKPIKTNEWHGLSNLGVRPSRSVKAFQEELTLLCGPDAMSILTRYGKSPRIVDAVRRVLTYIDMKGNMAYGRLVLIWICKNNMQRPVIDAIRDNISIEDLKNAIDNDKTIARGNWLVK